MTALAKRLRESGDLEGFDLAVLDTNGTPVPTNQNGWAKFNYDRMAKGATTVTKWKANRFNQTYGPSFQCVVMNADGTEAHANTKLSSVRTTYEADGGTGETS